MKLFGYVRVHAQSSLYYSKSENEYLSHQKEEILEFCKKNQCELVDFFEDNCSSTVIVSQRTGYNLLCENIHENCGVIFTQRDRLTSCNREFIEIHEAMRSQNIILCTSRDQVDKEHPLGGYVIALCNVLSKLAC